MKNSKALIVMIPLAVLLLGVVAYQYGYLKIRSEMTALKEEEEMKTKILGKYINLISKVPELEKKLTEKSHLREFYKTELLQGETDAIAAAALQELVKGLLISRGGKISRELIGQPAEMGKFKIVNISLDASMPDVRALSDAIYSVETNNNPSLFINDIDIRVKDLKEPRELIVKLNVSAMTGGK